VVSGAALCISCAEPGIASLLCGPHPHHGDGREICPACSSVCAVSAMKSLLRLLSTAVFATCFAIPWNFSCHGMLLMSSGPVYSCCLARLAKFSIDLLLSCTVYERQIAQGWLRFIGDILKGAFACPQACSASAASMHCSANRTVSCNGVGGLHIMSMICKLVCRRDVCCLSQGALVRA
jgi:hypothetical protein